LGSASENISEMSFRLHGRLFARQLDIVEHEMFASIVENYADRPWLRSIDPFLTRPEGPLIVSRNVGFNVYCVLNIPDSTHVVAVGSGVVLVIINIANGRIVHAFQGHVRDVQSVAVSADGSSDDVGWGRRHGPRMGRNDRRSCL
jgi:hypothetical protein